jgi:hypothetical protein
MNLEECEAILAAVIKNNLFKKGDLNKAHQYLDAGDVEGFERICRGQFWWIKDKGVPCILTDGPAEGWYDDGRLKKQVTMKIFKVPEKFKNGHEYYALAIAKSGVFSEIHLL